MNHSSRVPHISGNKTFWLLTADRIWHWHEVSELACWRDHRFLIFLFHQYRMRFVNSPKRKSKLSFFTEGSRGKCWRNFFIMLLGNHHASVLPPNRHLTFRKWFQIMQEVSSVLFLLNRSFNTWILIGCGLFHPSIYNMPSLRPYNLCKNLSLLRK